MGVKGLFRRKQVDSDRLRAEGHHQLAKALSVSQLIAIGNFFCFVLLCSLVVRNLRIASEIVQNFDVFLLDNCGAFLYVGKEYIPVN